MFPIQLKSFMFFLKMRYSHVSDIVFALVMVAAAMLLVVHLPTTDASASASADDLQRYNICSTPIPCANKQNMSYPFWGGMRPDYCGHPTFKLECSGGAAKITIMSLTYRVLDIHQTARTLRVVRTDYSNDLCPAHLVNSTLDSTHFDLAFGTEAVRLYYNCPRSDNLSVWFDEFSCNSDQTHAISNYFVYHGSDYLLVTSCKECVVVYVSSYHVLSVDIIYSGFDLEWKANDTLCDGCQVSGGQCGYDSASGEFTCHCQDRSYRFTCGSDYEGPYAENYLNCSTRSHCAGLNDIIYPFWGGNKPEYCGHPDFKLNCSGQQAEITIISKTYQVLVINQTSHTLMVAAEDFYEAYYCPGTYPAHNLSFVGSIFMDYPLENQDITIFYNCEISNINASVEINTSYHCNNKEDVLFNFILTDDLRAKNQTKNGIPLSDVIRTCSGGSTVVPVSRSRLHFLSEGSFEIGPTNYFDYYYWVNEIYYQNYKINGFWLEWELPNHTKSRCDDCQKSGGVCGYNSSSRDFSCYCRDRPYPLTCVASSAGSSSKRDWAIGISAALAGITTITILIIYKCKRESISSKLGFLKKDESDGFNVEAFIENYGPFAPKRYTYANVRKMTNSFAERVGRGGFGSVYKGKLFDGSLVAVKVLKESKSNGEEFINEVASIGRTSHINIVTLVGFCYERNKRALVYEYMPNGSLDKFIFNRESAKKNIRLEWKTLYEIASGIARGLEYLHRGCTTRILHFDIKPHNILLDKNFCPKISDFGLAKLCRREDSIVSMLGARGTAGYVAPEVYCRNFGRVSYKSDVYSYGMMVLEMVGGRKNIDVGVSRTSKIYFPDWLHNHVNDYGENLEIGEEMTNEDEEMVRKMILVSLWCIQTLPCDRPSMTKVLEMLEGSLQSLQIPPKPTFSLPTEQ